MQRFRFRPWIAVVALAIGMVFVAAEADARIGRGGSFGSRGARTFTPPAATQTAPRPASPFERSATPQTRPAAGAPAAGPTGGLFNRPGLMGGLAAGFLGAGLLGLLMGNGLLGGLGSLASIIGLLLQVGLVILVARLAWSWWQRRNGAPAFAGLPRQVSNEPNYHRPEMGGSSGGGAAPSAANGNIELTPADFDTFERLLGEIQAAYSNEDIAAVRQRVTPEMASYFEEDLADHASSGVVNRISDVKLLQGDLAEAWREGSTEYATVAMRFSLIDQMIEKATGRVVEGSAEPTQATEVWTFVRDRGRPWVLSAVQQA